MQLSRGRRGGTLLVGLTLAAAAAAAGGGAVGATTAPPGTDPAASEAAGTEPAGTDAAPGTDAGAPAATGAPSGSGVPTGGEEGAAPTCTGEADGVLTFQTVLPETGNLAFLGPPEFAGAELAAQDINDAGGVLGQPVELLQGDSGDLESGIAPQTVDAGLAAGADAFIGAASSGVSMTFIDKLVTNCKIHFSPANTSPEFTTYPDDGLYFRTAPSDVMQGQVLGDLLIQEGITSAAFLAIDDPYGQGLLEKASQTFEDQGGTVADAFYYDPGAATFTAEADRIIAANPDALVMIGFEESAQILTSLFEGGFTVADGKRVYFVDGNMGNALGEQFDAGLLEGQRGTLPQAPLTPEIEELRARLLEIDPELIDYTYGPETYDSMVVTALAAEVAGSDNPALIAAAINGVTRDGEKCTTFADCKALIEAGTDIDYDGVSGPLEFGPAGEPSKGTIAIQTYDANNVVDETLTETVAVDLEG